MRKILLIAAFALLISVPVSAQVPTESQCPAISVFGPAGIVMPGDIAKYTVKVDTKGEKNKLEYDWSVSSGTIVSGQGTTTIEVKQPSGGLCVTANVKGKCVPDGCINMSSESSCGLPPPPAAKLDELVGSLDRVSKQRFERAWSAAKAEPNSQVYIIISGTPKNTSASIRKKRNVILKSFVSVCGYDTQRITFVNSGVNNGRVVIWLVPPGANPPVP